MLEWWNSLPLIGTIFAIIAIPATIIMVIQSLLLFFGVGFDHDVDVGNDHDFMDGTEGLSLITIRTVVAFFSIGGWTGLVCISGGLSTWVSILIAFVAGSIALVGIALLFKYSLKLQDRGNLDIHNAGGKTGEVYIPIPMQRQGHGKINLLVQEKYTEFDAVTDETRVLKTGEMVVVTSIINDQTVLVRLITDEKETNNKKEIGGISQWIQ